jgi:fluoride exporter
MILFVGFGGAIGAVLRYQIGIWITKMKRKTAFPIATFIVNLLGSFGLGLLFALHEQELINNWLWSFLGVGFFGAFTTFSTFSYEIIKLISEGKQALGIIYLLLSVVIGITFASIGICVI